MLQQQESNRVEWGIPKEKPTKLKNVRCTRSGWFETAAVLGFQTTVPYSKMGQIQFNTQYKDFLKQIEN